MQPFPRALSWPLAAALAFGAAGCTSVIPQPTTADVRWAAHAWPGSTEQDLASGRDLYVRKCGGCHELFAPSHLTAARWPGALVEMGSRANLEAHDRELILRYLVTETRDTQARAAR